MLSLSLPNHSFTLDFVILHENLTVVQRCQQIIVEWLSGIGLELKPSKTRISHTLNQHEGNVGFDFLGFTIRQFPVGKCHSGKNRGGTLLGFKTIITPSQAKLKAHTQQVGKLIERHKSAPQADLIAHLNPIIRGWTNYYASVVSKRIFNEADSTLFSQLKAWAKHRHPNKSSHWCCQKYWQTFGLDNWVFTPIQRGIRLRKHRETPIADGVTVRLKAMPVGDLSLLW